MSCGTIDSYWYGESTCGEDGYTCIPCLIEERDRLRSELDAAREDGVNHKARQAHAVPDRAAWLTIDEICSAVRDALEFHQIGDEGLSHFIARKIAKSSLEKKVRITSCAGCLGSSFDTRFQCSGCVDHSKYELKED